MDLPQSEMTKSVYEYDSFNGCKRAKCEDRVIRVRERKEKKRIRVCLEECKDRNE